MSSCTPRTWNRMWATEKRYCQQKKDVEVPSGWPIKFYTNSVHQIEDDYKCEDGKLKWYSLYHEVDDGGPHSNYGGFTARHISFWRKDGEPMCYESNPYSELPVQRRSAPPENVKFA